MAAGAGNDLLRQMRRQGAVPDGEGTRFRVFSSCAERVELCLFDAAGIETARLDMTPEGEGDWALYCHGIGAGQRYGYRVHGEWSPDRGLRANPAKLLLDPYARRITGEFHWDDAVFDYIRSTTQGDWQLNELDSSPFVPRSMVCADPPPLERSLLHRWSDSIIYETNVRGFTMRCPDIPAAERGRFAGLRNGEIIAYLKALGVNTIELQPVHHWIDEQHLARQGLRNYWGYNSIGFFAPDQRLAGADPVQEFRAMVASLHEAGLSVLLDVAYNHTGEGDALGPTLCFRGLDNLAWYRVEPDDPAVHINDTGTGNTLNADHPRARALVLDSLVYWRRVMGVDGFRFDLAPVLGRHAHGFDPDHPLLRAIGNTPELADVRLVAEPWDPGPGGYQLGNFPERWSEWNDRYRDSLRRFWRGDHLPLDELALSVDGSPDLFRPPGRGAANSVNFVTAHDGFTLTDLVSFQRRHNQANGEDNRDGHRHNYSENHGIEGPTDNRVVLARRRRHRLNLVGTLLLSQGVPMLLAGDELGHSQQGNNNAYAQDNELAWLDWSLRGEDEAFLASVRRLLALRSAHGLLHGKLAGAGSGKEQGGYPGDDAAPLIRWYAPEGDLLSGNDWRQRRAALQVLSDPLGTIHDELVAVYINGHDHEVEFHLPQVHGRPLAWTMAWSSADGHEGPAGAPTRVAAWSVGLLLAD